MSTATSGRTREYRAIEGHPGYEVSSDGVVRSWIPWKGTPVPRELRQFKNPSGYLIVRLRRQTLTVHRLVALAFLGEAGGVVRHLNDEKQDNRVENLAWGTRSDNALDAVRNGHHFLSSLEVCRNGGHPLTPRDGKGKRRCKTCAAARERRARAEGRR